MGLVGKPENVVGIFFFSVLKKKMASVTCFLSPTRLIILLIVSGAQLHHCTYCTPCAPGAAAAPHCCSIKSSRAENRSTLHKTTSASGPRAPHPLNISSVYDPPHSSTAVYHNSSIFLSLFLCRIPLVTVPVYRHVCERCRYCLSRKSGCGARNCGYTAHHDGQQQGKQS